MITITVIANKTDLADCMSTDEISEALGTATIPAHVTWAIVRASANTRDGVDEALAWVTERMPTWQVQPRPKPHEVAGKKAQWAGVVEWLKQLLQ